MTSEQGFTGSAPYQPELTARPRCCKDITSSIEPGEFFALLGPSGSGKSTLLRLIAGFNRHQRGEVLIDGEDITGMPPWQRNVGMVFQNYALWPHMTVWNNVAFGLEERRCRGTRSSARSARRSSWSGLSQYAERRPGQLSGGQQQRVALARTIVIEPKLLLLDEPLSNLDANLRVQMREEIKNLQRTLGLTTIFVTHDQEEAHDHRRPHGGAGRGRAAAGGLADGAVRLSGEPLRRRFRRHRQPDRWQHHAGQRRDHHLPRRRRRRTGAAAHQRHRRHGQDHDGVPTAHGQHPGARRTCRGLARLARRAGAPPAGLRPPAHCSRSGARPASAPAPVCRAGRRSRGCANGCPG